jgi:hypothetical protein
MSNGKCKRRHSFAKKARCDISSEKFKKEDEDLKIFIQDGGQASPSLGVFTNSGKDRQEIAFLAPASIFHTCSLPGFNFPPCTLALPSTY